MNDTTDLMAMAESLVETNEPETEEAEAEEVSLDEEAETDELEAEADEVEAETDEAEEASDDADDTEDDTDEDDGDEELHIDTYTVKVDGQEVEVTLDDLKRSFSGQSFIQKGMEENAKSRKELEQAQNALKAEYQRFVEFATQVQNNGLQPEPTQPDPAKAETDPIGYMQEQAKYQQDLAAYNTQKAELDRMKDAETQQTQAQQQAYIAEQAKRLQERVPEFANAESATEIKGKLLKVGTEHYGFTADEMASIGDSRSVEVLVDALKYRELIAGKAKAKKKPEAPRNIKPKAKRVNTKAQERQKLEQRAKKSGKVEDFVDLMFVNG